MKKRTFIKLSSMMMAGAAASPLIDWAQDGKLHNWAGNLTYGTTSLLEAGSAEEIKAFLQKYPRLKVLGTRHCFNRIADSDHHLLSLRRMNRIIGFNADKKTVTVESGVRYGELAVWLHQRGYALHNLASLPHISVAGGCITATHGSGAGNANLPSAVRALELMTADGSVLHLSREKDPEIFHGAVVNLGALGVMTTVTLAVEPTYQVSQRVYQGMPMAVLQTHFDEIMSAGYSVSLFTDWRNHKINEVWIKSRTDDPRIKQHGDLFYGGKAATHDLHPISDLSAENCTPQMGVPGPWHERLPHFRMGFTPSSGKELQSEFFVPREKSWEAIQAVEKLHAQISPHLLISEIRSIAADQLWLSPCYGRACTAIHFTWKPEWPAVSKLIPQIEAQLMPFHVRPHWGKLFSLSPLHIRNEYEKWNAFRQLRDQCDPHGKFGNEFLTMFA
ncbi:MAG: FAD-binding protein [Luteolibacter sp.]